MVAGGYNARDSGLTSVEYLDLGTDLNKITTNNLTVKHLKASYNAKF